MVFDILNVLNVWGVFSLYLLISNDAYISHNDRKNGSKYY